MKTVSTNISLPIDVWTRAKHVAVDRRCSMNSLITLALMNELGLPVEIDEHGRVHPKAAQVFIAGLAALRQASDV